MGPRSPTGRSNTSESGCCLKLLWVICWMLEIIGARWLLPITFFLLFTAARQSEALIATPNLELAMMGYDPLMTDIMEQPDHGRKLRLFIAKQRDPLYVEKKDEVLNDFVDEVQHSRCSPSLTDAVVQTYEEYKSLTSSAISFATEADAITPLGATQFNFKEKAGYGNQNTPNAVFIRKIFNESLREATLIKAECLTHTVSILPYHEAVFTPAFESALYALHKAAMDTNSETRHKVFKQFVSSYGTHFARTTHFGYAAYFLKFFATQAKTPAEETVRHRCMLESARETLAPGSRKGYETIAEHFSRVIAGKCGENEVYELVTETGSASVSDAGDCDFAAKESPRPVAYILEKISALFEETWIGSQTLETRQVRLNATALSAFFEEQLGQYSYDVVEQAVTPSKNLCPWRHSMTPSTTAGPRSMITGPPSMATRPPSTGPPNTTADPSSTTAGPSSMTVGPSNTTAGPPRTTAGPPSTTAGPSKENWTAFNGRIIIVGGVNTNWKSHTPYSVALFGPALPPFPVGVAGNTMSQAASSVYSCGSIHENGNKNRCWTIDAGTEGATWRSFDIPWVLRYHSAVVVQEQIWFFLNSKLRILNTRNSADKFSEINLGFRFSEHICAVAHGSQTFVIGVGEGKNEVYVNTDYLKPEKWERFSTLLQGRQEFGCLVFGGDVFITGGEMEETGIFLSSVEAIRVVDGAVRGLGPLGGGREAHKMAIIDGRPAVLGGWNGTILATIETYDEHNNSWKTLGFSLEHPRRFFGLTQFLP